MKNVRILPVVIVATVFLAVAGVVSTQRTFANVAADLEPFREAMANSTTVYFAAKHIPRRGRDELAGPDQSNTESYIGYSAADGRMVIEFRGIGDTVWWYWDGHTVHEDGEPLDRRNHPPLLVPILADLLEEMRAGLPNYVVVAENPPNTDPVADVRWGRLARTDGVDVIDAYIGVWTRDGMPHEAVLVGGGIASTFREPELRVRLEFEFDVPIPVGAFRKSRTRVVCPPDGWRGLACRPPHESADSRTHLGAERMAPPSRPASDYERGGRCAAFPEHARPPDGVIPGC